MFFFPLTEHEILFPVSAGVTDEEGGSEEESGSEEEVVGEDGVRRKVKKKRGNNCFKNSCFVWKFQTIREISLFSKFCQKLCGRIT